MTLVIYDGKLIIGMADPWKPGMDPLPGSKPVEGHILDVKEHHSGSAMVQKLGKGLVDKVDRYLTWKNRDDFLKRAQYDEGLQRRRTGADRAQAAFDATYPKPPEPTIEEMRQYVQAQKEIASAKMAKDAATPPPPLTSRSWPVQWRFNGNNVVAKNMSADAIREGIERGWITEKSKLYDVKGERWIEITRFPELAEALNVPGGR